jgi:D-sedoheptulose 7-phosphate isomerase
MKAIILEILADSIQTKRGCVERNVDKIEQGADMLAHCINAGGKILIFGNGGSAADAQHLAAEFVNRFQIERPPLAAIALSTDTSIITSIGNDYHFNDIFSKQVAALGKPGDIAWGFSTSGNSANVVNAMKTARQGQLATIGMTGRGGELVECVDLVFTVESNVTARIQETHITLGHILCEMVDRTLYPGEYAKRERA